MPDELPTSLALPDLSGLDNQLTANYLLNLLFRGSAFSDYIARGLALGVVRTTESAVRGYERSRLLLVQSIAEDRIGLYFEGLGEMEVAVTALHRAMRVVEALCASRATMVNDGWLPAQDDRELLRLMRNAIDHVDGPIADGRFGEGENLFLFVTDTDLIIDEGSGELRVGHVPLGEWFRQLHILATEITRSPEDWEAPGSR